MEQFTQLISFVFGSAKGIALLLLAAPLISFVLLFFIKSRKLVNLVSISSISISLLAALYLLKISVDGNTFSLSTPWLTVGNIHIDFSIHIDIVSVLMLTLVSIVAIMVLVFSTEYMRNESRYSIFFGYISLFVFAMFGLLISRNLFWMYLFWELVGFCSYLLIGFYTQKQSAILANKKAFIINRIGDLGFLAGLMLLLSSLGTLDLYELATRIQEHGSFVSIADQQLIHYAGYAFFIAVIPGFGASAQWQEWLLFRFGGSFPANDPEFGVDIGFYVFKLPFLSSVVDWMFGFLIVTALAVAVVHYLNGAIRVQPLGERVSQPAKAQLSVLLALAAFTKALDYWLQRFELLTSSGSSFDGAGYADISASLPAIQLMILISIFAGLMLLVNIRRKGWALPVIILGLWALIAIVAGGIYPSFVQRFQVEPAELAKEKPYIERNITATRTALALGDVGKVDFDYEPILTPEVAASETTNMINARLLDPTIVLPTIQDLQVEREYYRFLDVDVDRYDIKGKRTPVVITARELNLDGVTNPTWEKMH